VSEPVRIAKRYTPCLLDRSHVIHTVDILAADQEVLHRYIELSTVDQPLEVVPDDRWMKRDARHG
jgi:hypothetical protein